MIDKIDENGNIMSNNMDKISQAVIAGMWFNLSKDEIMSLIMSNEGDLIGDFEIWGCVFATIAASAIIDIINDFKIIKRRK